MSISVVVPVYNEVENIDELITRLVSTLSSINNDYEIIFVMDPSTDGTEEKILSWQK